MVVETRCAVLVVEDHADTAEMVKRSLARHGVTAEVAATASAALQVIARVPPRCIILDEAMPDINGLTLYRQMVSQPEYKRIPVFFYSASYDWRKQMEAEQLGARGWFVKGVSRLPDLIESVVNVCRKG